VLGFTYPLIYLKVCVQAQKEAPLLSTVAMAKKIISQNGVLGLWQGLCEMSFFPVFVKTVSNS
jgi:hypothetical protein